MGAAAYALLDAVFLGVVAVTGIVAAAVAVRRGSRFRTTIVTGIVVAVVLLVMTIVFDNVIVGLGIVAYDPARISGVRLGVVPVEDLAYALAAVVLLPSLAVLFGRPPVGRESIR
jgi:lycopene cyclase domain-containing protein